MFVVLAGGFGAGTGFNGSDYGFNLGLGDHAWAQDFGRWAGGQREDGTFDPDSARSTVENEVDAVAKSVADVVGSGGGNMGESVGAGSGQGELDGLKERQSKGMSRYAKADSGKARSDDIRDGVGLGDDDGERTRPEGLG